MSAHDRPTAVLERAESRAATRAPAQTVARADRPPARGWGSHEERRMMTWAVAGFFLLGLYAAVFVAVGAVVWS